jgi:hypothetical protein
LFAVGQVPNPAKPGEKPDGNKMGGRCLPAAQNIENVSKATSSHDSS